MMDHGTIGVELNGWTMTTNTIHILVRFLDFFSIHNSVYVVIQSSSDPITMEQLSENFTCNFVVEDSQQMVVVEVETIRNLLCV
jgi:hypothetical protein